MDNKKEKGKGKEKKKTRKRNTTNWKKITFPDFRGDCRSCSLMRAAGAMSPQLDGWHPGSQPGAPAPPPFSYSLLPDLTFSLPTSGWMTQAPVPVRTSSCKRLRPHRGTSKEQEEPRSGPGHRSRFEGALGAPAPLDTPVAPRDWIPRRQRAWDSAKPSSPQPPGSPKSSGTHKLQRIFLPKKRLLFF